MKKETSAINEAIGLFYAAGVVVATGIFLFNGFSSGKWVANFFASLSGGIGFGLLMHAVVNTLTSLKSNKFD